jgi:hypothetical protein
MMGYLPGRGFTLDIVDIDRSSRSRSSDSHKSENSELWKEHCD